MTDRYLWHVTLDTGHSRRSYRNEVDDAVITLVRQQINEALSGLHVVIRPGYTLMANTAAGALLVTVIADTNAPLCTIAIARNSRQSRDLWSMLKQPVEIGAVATGEPPPPPWCAVRLYPGLAEHVDALAWLGDFERCVAWGWIDRAMPGIMDQP